VEKKITLKVNEREIAMNPFVQRVFTNVVQGLVDSLDKIPGDRQRVEITLVEDK
jgi:hypothetical protein